jgi:glycolate oxidase iron-sulfur subunit
MHKMTELAKLLKGIEADLAGCARCGMCLSACPLFLETGREADAARGKLALLDGLLEEIFDSPQGATARLDRCLLCGSCAAICPNGVNATETFLKARVAIAEVIGLPAVKRRVLKKMLADPGRFDRAVKWAHKIQTWAIKPESNLIGTASLKFSPWPSPPRHFIPLAPVSFQDSISAHRKADVSSGKKILFFTGCLIDKILPRIAEAAMKVFHHHHITVFVPETQGCCGIPALSSGDADTMKQLIFHHLNLFGAYDFDFLVTACATCTYTIKKLWPMISGDDEDTRIRTNALSAKTRDITECIASLVGLKQELPDYPEKVQIVSYHDSCHLKKSLGVYQAPRSLILANPHYKLVEMEKSDRCCGMGGSFNLSHYDLSGRIGSRKLNSILSTHCHTVAAGCPACMIQLSDLLSKSGRGITVKHPIEIYAESLP